MMLLFIFIIVFLSAFFPENYQELGIIFSLILLNFYLYHVHKKNVKGLVISLVITIIYIILIYVQYYNALALGYKDGIIYGIVRGMNYDDMHSYFYVSQWTATTISGILKDMWWRGELVFLENFNMYHPFVIFNALLHLIFGPHLISFILIKLFFTVGSVYLFYQISRRYLSENLGWCVVAILFILPSNILVSTSLMRDNLLLFLVLLYFYIVLRLKENKGMMWLNITLLVLTASLMVWFRIYFILILFSTVLYWLLTLRYNWWRGMILLLFLILMMITILNFIQFEDLVLQVIAHLEEGSTWETKTTEGINLYIYWLYYLFLGQTTILNDIHFDILQDVLNHFSLLFQNYILFAFFLSWLYLLITKQFKDKKALIIFGFVMPSSQLLLHNIILGFPIPRIYLTWIWIDLIIIAIALQTLKVRHRLSFVSGIFFFITFYFLFRNM